MISQPLYELATHQDDYDGKGGDERVLRALYEAGAVIVWGSGLDGGEYDAEPENQGAGQLWWLTKGED